MICPNGRFPPGAAAHDGTPAAGPAARTPTAVHPTVPRTAGARGDQLSATPAQQLEPTAASTVPILGPASAAEQLPGDDPDISGPGDDSYTSSAAYQY